MRLLLIYFVQFVILNLPTALKGQESAKLLNLAIYEDEINGDLDLAIKKYNQVLTLFPSERPIVAEVLYRLGLANEKKGIKKAREYYLRLITNYADQTKFTAQAKSRMQNMNSRSTSDQIPITTSSLPKTNLLRTSKVYFRGGPVGKISSDGKYLTYGAPLGNLAIYDRINDETIILTPDPKKKDAGRNVAAKPKGISSAAVWSPDNKKIAYFWIREDTGEDLRIYDLETGEIRILCPYKGKEIPMPIEWTKDGKYLLCTVWYRQEDIVEIILIDVEKCYKRILKKLPPNQYRIYPITASMSPDNAFILYSDANLNGKYDMILQSVDGVMERKIFDKPGSHESDPLWLPDGKSFLFYSDYSNSNALWKAYFDNDLNITKSEILIDGVGGIYSHVGLTRSGEYYYWSHVQIVDLYTTPIDVQANQIGIPRMLSNDNNSIQLCPNWSFDGKKIAYRSSARSIEVKNFESGESKEIVLDLPKNSTIAVTSPVWAYGDEKIFIVVRNRGVASSSSIFTGTVYEIFRLDVETHEMKKIVEDGVAPEMWSDNEIIFIRDRSLVKKNLLSGIEQVVFTANEHLAYAYDISPDGKSLAFLIGPTVRYHNELVIYSSQMNSFDTILCVSDKVKLMGALWLSDSKRILLQYLNIKNNHQELYVVNSVTGEKIKIEYDLENPGHRMFSLDIDPGNKNLVYHILKSSANLWLLENF